jgi:formylmethanofuran dehydrogenase subunit E
MQTSSLNDEIIQKVRSFHGHMCPGIAIGLRAAEMALREIGPHSEAQEVVAVVETDMCAVDAIQVLTGCTFGKGNLIHRDYGKKAFSFYRRTDGKAIRIITRPSAMDFPGQEREALFEKMHAGSMTKEEEQRFAELQDFLSQRILQTPLDDLFDIKAPPPLVPERARIHQNIPCEACGEEVMRTRIREIAGRRLCIPCAEK